MVVVIISSSRVSFRLLFLHKSIISLGFRYLFWWGKSGNRAFFQDTVYSYIESFFFPFGLVCCWMYRETTEQLVSPSLLI